MIASRLRPLGLDPPVQLPPEGRLVRTRSSPTRPSPDSITDPLRIYPMFWILNIGIATQMETFWERTQITANGEPSYAMFGNVVPPNYIFKLN